MSDWKAKRFWKETSVEACDAGYQVLLDGRPVKTPSKSDFAVPTRTLADLISAEWQAQEEDVRPDTMPFTRMANSAIDKVTVQHGAVADMLAEYGGTDLICYRATDPAELIERQAVGWDPLIAWAESELGAKLEATAGVMFHAQPDDSLAVLRDQVHAMDPFILTAFHDLVALSGSLIIGFAALRGYDTPENLWEISRIDESWQIHLWGKDDESEQMSAVKRQSFLDAWKFYSVL